MDERTLILLGELTSSYKDLTGHFGELTKLYQNLDSRVQVLERRRAWMKWAITGLSGAGGAFLTWLFSMGGKH